MTQGSDNPDASQPAGSEVPFDTLTQLLGGARGSDVQAGADGAALIDDATAAALDSPHAWLTPGTDATPPSVATLRQLLLEVLSLKLRAFAAIVDQVDATRAPLTATCVRARLLDDPGLLGAARWHVILRVAATPPQSAAELASLTLRTSLGHLLSRLLFRTDERTADEAQTRGTKLAATFARGSGSDPHENAERLFDHGPGADPTELFHRRDQRTCLDSRALPAGLWSDVGTLLLQLLSDVPGFALPDAPLDALRLRLKRLRLRLDVATFGAVPRRDEISAMLRHNLSRLRDQ
ncbi:MAG: hypothetical protein KAI24_02345 [Planctomycetes bacterium]|nr:hypothetical protein [Planctomycetota bacterium]